MPAQFATDILHSKLKATFQKRFTIKPNRFSTPENSPVEKMIAPAARLIANDATKRFFPTLFP
jgi:hypothetical protein